MKISRQESDKNNNEELVRWKEKKTVVKTGDMNEGLVAHTNLWFML